VVVEQAEAESQRSESRPALGSYSLRVGTVCQLDTRLALFPSLKSIQKIKKKTPTSVALSEHTISISTLCLTPLYSPPVKPNTHPFSVPFSPSKKLAVGGGSLVARGTTEMTRSSRPEREVRDIMQTEVPAGQSSSESGEEEGRGEQRESE
jgi:hypothetical protein